MMRLVEEKGNNEVLSDKLETWLKSSKPKTIAGLSRVFQQKSFAFLILVLMAVPALPIPTAGISHLFELIAMLLALEMIAGRRTVWLPKRWKRIKLGKPILEKGLPTLINRIRWLEARTKRRGERFFRSQSFSSFIGLVLFTLCLTALCAPPFSGLDTLPSIGAVLICLALIVEDALLLLFGMIAGAVGTTVVVSVIIYLIATFS